MTRVVALTGNIASGKSTVSRLLAERGATVIDADELARTAVAPGSPAHRAIAARWPSVVAPDGTLDRAALRAIVFGNDAERRALDAIVHPAVAALRDQRVEAARQRSDPVVVYDVPLLFEADDPGRYDAIILVDAPEHTRLERLVRDRGLDRAQAQAMIAAQQPAAEKRARADHVIENDRDPGALRSRVDALWRALGGA